MYQMRNPKEVEKDEYNEFYKKTFNEFLDPLSYTHFTTEVLMTEPIVKKLLKDKSRINELNLTCIYKLNRVRWNSEVFSIYLGWPL